ncbi:Ig-like domain-containing protein, partial [Sunxiuqinia dokdonensis]|uniref:Ig-like domain-containing protein n=1 Tax=Sunxiuqinia dokdonensis TaxID=1409788 RepID=UPI000A6166E6
MKEKPLPQSKKLYGLLMFTIFFLMTSLISLAQEVTVFTDKDDYWPGEWVIITGSGWTADDSVLITLTHIDPNIPDHSHDPWYVAPDENGDIYDEWFVLDQELGTAFHLTALGFNTGWFAETWFTDGQVKAKTQTSGITSTINYAVYNNPDDCSGTIVTSGSVAITDGNTNIYNVGNNERLLITAAPYSDQGGIFQGWYNTNNLLLTTDLSFCTDNSLTNIIAQYSEECTPPTSYGVTGTGTYCAGESGLEVGLSGSETGVDYQLYVGGTTVVGSPVAGTGSAISFGTQPAGTYTIVATRVAGGCTTDMNGNAVVTENLIDPGEIAKGATNPGPGCGSLNPNAAGTAASGSTDASGSGTIIYQWENSTDESIWTEISGATEISFNIPTISETTYYRRVATSTLNGVACSATSNVLEYVVNPLPEVTSISPGGTTEVCVDATLQLSNTTAGGVWSSGDEAIATVDATGLVTGVAEGTVTISYSVSNEFSCEKSASKTVNVYALPAAPTANNEIVTYDGTEQTASATVPSGFEVDWYTTETGTETTTAPAGTNAGTYTAWAEARNTTTGCVSERRTEVTLEIEKRPITITADAK